MGVSRPVVASLSSRCSAVILLLLLAAVPLTLAFVPSSSILQHQCTRCVTFTAPKKSNQKITRTSRRVVSVYSSNNAAVEITFPTPEEAASMGIRDWPQKFYSSDYTESVNEGQIATRYVLDGKGRVTIDYYDDNNLDTRQRLKQRVYPGTLIEVDGEATLYWEVDDEKEGIIVLTPNYEDGKLLGLVAGAMVIFCAGLIVGSTGL